MFSVPWWEVLFMHVLAVVGIMLLACEFLKKDR